MNGMNINWRQKLTSRKLWAAIAGRVVGIAAAFGITENDWAQIAGVVTSAASVVAYIFGESAIDAAREDANRTVDVKYPDGYLDGTDESGE